MRENLLMEQTIHNISGSIDRAYTDGVIEPVRSYLTGEQRRGILTDQVYGLGVYYLKLNKQEAWTIRVGPDLLRE